MLLMDLGEWLSWRRVFPGRVDIEAGAVYTPGLLQNVDAALKAEFRVALIGAAGRGKTTTGKLLAFNRNSTGQPVWAIDFSERGPQTPRQLAAAIRNRDRRRPLWILDDCLEDPEAPETFENLREAILDAGKSEFLFIGRDPDPDEPGIPSDFLEDLVSDGAVFRCRPDERFLQGVIRKYIGAHSLEPRFLVRPELDEAAFEWVLRTTGGDLRRLQFYLDAWDPRDEPLHALSPERIAESIVKSTLQPLAAAGPEVLQTFVEVSAIAQFDVAVARASFPPSALTNLQHRGLLWPSGVGYCRPPHASDSQHVVEAYAWWRARSTQAITVDAFVRYVDDLKHELSPGAVLFLLMRLSRWAHGTLSPALADRVVNVLPDTPSIPSFRYLIESVDDVAYVSRLVDRVGKGTLVSLLKGSTANNVRVLLKAIRERIPLLAEELEAELTLEDKINQYTASSTRGIATSLHHYHRDRGSQHFAKKLLAATVNCGFDERVERSSVAGCGRLLEVANAIDVVLAGKAAQIVAARVDLRRGASAEELSLLIRNAEASKNAERRLVERILAECDPADFLLPARRRGFGHLLRLIREHSGRTPLTTKAKRFFEAWTDSADVAMTSELDDRGLAATIWNVVLSGTDPEPWLGRSLSQIASRLGKGGLVDIFYILWNVLQADESIYRRLLVVARHDLESRLSGRAGVEELALIGLLDYTKSLGQLGKPVCRDTQEIVSGLRARKDCSFVLFALNGLRALAPSALDSVRTALVRTRGWSRFLKSAIEEHPVKTGQRHLRTLAGSLLLIVD